VLSPSINIWAVAHRWRPPAHSPHRGPPAHPPRTVDHKRMAGDETSPARGLDSRSPHCNKEVEQPCFLARSGAPPPWPGSCRRREPEDHVGLGLGLTVDEEDGRLGAPWAPDLGGPERGVGR
jgi:hypothetical protein